MKQSLFSFSAFCALVLALYACDTTSKKYADTYNSGSINIAVDEAHKPLIEAEIHTFEALYPKAKIKGLYVSEGEAINLLALDTARLTIINRELSPEEKSLIEKNNLKLRSIKIATDAVALITHRSQKDSLFTADQIEGILKGNIKTWGELKAKDHANSQAITCVFDKANSANYGFMKQYYGIKEGELKGKVFAAGSNEAVIDYVSKNPGSIGFIGVSYISDTDSKEAVEFTGKVRIAGISKLSEPKSEDDYFQPYQAYIATDEYLYSRPLYIISRESRNGLGSSFMTFCAGDEGQRIILKAGLMPATQPVRVVQMNKGMPSN